MLGFVVQAQRARERSVGLISLISAGWVQRMQQGVIVELLGLPHLGLCGASRIAMKAGEGGSRSAARITLEAGVPAENSGPPLMNCFRFPGAERGDARRLLTRQLPG
jgi:hypothetical protein